MDSLNLDEQSLYDVPIDEATLRQLSKTATGLVPDPNDSSTDIQRRSKDLIRLVDASLDTANLRDIPGAHRGASCNLLCAIIERTNGSSHEVLRQFVWDHNVWPRLFSVFLEQFDKSKGKSMKQVLVVLTSIIQRSLDDDRAKQAMEDASSLVIEIIFTQRERFKIKPAVQALSHFLTKDVLSINQMLELSKRLAIGNDDADQVTWSPLQHILRHVVGMIPNHDLTLSATHLFSVLLNKSDKYEKENVAGDAMQLQSPPWLEPLVISMRRAPEAIQDFKHYLFPILFKSNLSAYLEFLRFLRVEHLISFDIDRGEKDSSQQNPSEDMELLFAALQSGKELGLLEGTNINAIKITAKVFQIPEALFSRLLVDGSPIARIAALSILISSVATTKPMPKRTLRDLQKYLPHLHAETDANTRSEIIGLEQRLIDRLRAITSSLQRSISKSQQVSTPSSADYSQTGLMRDILRKHIQFLYWYIEFITADLRPGASYQRHFLALRGLIIILKSGLDLSVPSTELSRQAQGDLKWEFNTIILNPCRIRMLLDLIMDPFDDVRQSAAKVLKLGLQHPDNKISQEFDATLNLESFVKRAEYMSYSTGRADHADGVARTYEFLSTQPGIGGIMVLSSSVKSRFDITNHLIQELEETLAVAQGDLSRAVSRYPVHGIFASLKYIIEQEDFYSAVKSESPDKSLLWKQFHQRLVACLHTIWECVKDILCSDAPEGHVPDEMEERDITTKDILSYSWRALKESSLLLRVLVLNTPMMVPCGVEMIEGSEIESLGRLCFVQLSELRHRGAFSTVAQTFSGCCLRCERAEDSQIKCLPELWYEETMLCIQDKASVLTRRSAGIPALLSGIVSANPAGDLLKRAIRDLQSEAVLEAKRTNVNEGKLPQVHALNCLKELFLNTKLGPYTEPHLADALDLAASRLESDVWPIRNCGLMLFRALVERLLGTGNTQTWSQQNQIIRSRLSYTKYPNLIPIITSMLKPKGVADNQMSILTTRERVFPALQILQQAPPPRADQEVIRTLVLRLTVSPHWHVRDMAARTYAALLRHTEQDDLIFEIINRPYSDQNALHGGLLCIKHTLKTERLNSRPGSTNFLKKCFKQLYARFTDLYTLNTCPFTKAVYIDLISSFELQMVTDPAFEESVDTIFRDHVSIMHQKFEAGPEPNRENRQEAPVMGAVLLDQSSAVHQTLLSVLQLAQGQSQEDNSPLEHMNQVRTILQRLSNDMTTCSTILELLQNIYCRQYSPQKSLFKDQILRVIYELAVNPDARNEIGIAARYALSDILDYESKQSSSSMLRCNELISDFTSGQLPHMEFAGPPSSLEGIIRLRGPLLAYHIVSGSSGGGKATEELKIVIRALRRYIHESNEFALRHAAVKSMLSIQEILGHRLLESQFEPCSLDLALATYDALNDDDDEIRDVAARVVSKIISQKFRKTSSHTVIPPLASQRLAEYLTRAYPDSNALALNAITNLTRSSIVNGDSLSPSIQEAFSQVRKEDTSLFAQEKQNLFIDDPREALIWSRVLRNLSTKAISNSQANLFAAWVTDGLHLLSQAASSETDGPLGWTSKPDIFVLGLRIIFGTGVLLKWRSKSRKVNTKGSAVRKALREFVDIGRKSQVHQIWLDSAEQILQESVIDRLSIVKNAMVTFTRYHRIEL